MNRIKSFFVGLNDRIFGAPKIVNLDLTVRPTKFFQPSLDLGVKQKAVKRVSRIKQTPAQEEFNLAPGETMRPVNIDAGKFSALYSVTSDGRVWTHRRNRYLTPFPRHRDKPKPLYFQLYARNGDPLMVSQREIRNAAFPDLRKMRRPNRKKRA